MKLLKKNENGTIMLEATFGILVSIFVMALLISVGFYLYQKTLVKIVCNEIAEEVSQSYKLLNISDTENIAVGDVANVGLYRYMVRDSKLRVKNENRATERANSRLTKTTLANPENKPKVEIKAVSDQIGRRHYEIKVSAKYSFLFGGLLERIGLKGMQTLTATTYVEGIDILHYVNSIKTCNYVVGKIEEHTMIGSLYDTTIKMVNSFGKVLGIID